jgi:biotin synthase-related radical SAM superfamily protein
MAFTTALIAHAPDADPEKSKCLIETPKYRLFVRLVRSQAQAIEVCQNLVRDEGVRSILLCPGFTHENVAELADAVGPNVGISVARGDGPSNKIAAEAMAQAGWFS